MPALAPTSAPALNRRPAPESPGRATGGIGGAAERRMRLGAAAAFFGPSGAWGLTGLAGGLVLLGNAVVLLLAQRSPGTASS